MNFIKPILSLFLLLTYSIGFAHGLIPHCHVGDSMEYTIEEHGESHHHLEHHNHSHAPIKDLEGDDVLHENHIDDSLFDYVVCLLSELPHNEDLAHQHYIPATINNDSKKGFAKTKLLAALLVTCFEFTSDETFIPLDRYVVNNSQSPFAVSSPHRGPPFLSCLSAETLV